MAIKTTFTGPSNGKVFPIAILVPTFSLLLMILIFPALIQHYHNRNVGATALVAGVLVALFNEFINALIWPNDDMEHWYNGVGLCDIEVKVMVFQNVLFPASVCCILKALAAVMNTNSPNWIQTTAQEKTSVVIDLLCCVAAPSLQMLFHYIVQPNRYYIYGVAGCTPSTDLSWLAMILLYLPPVLWTLIDVFYAILVMIRLVRYRATFNSILASSNTNKSRFVRLYILCCVTTLAMLPLEILTLYINLEQGVYPYFWSMTHTTDGSWDSAIFVASEGGLFYDRIIWLCGAVVVFFLFGFGQDAMKMYREAMLKLGLGRILPSPRHGISRSNPSPGTIGTIGSKARLWLKRKEASATWTDSTDTTSAPSPKNMPFLDSIPSPDTNQPKAPSTSSNFASHVKKTSPRRSRHDDPFIPMKGAGTSTFHSAVTAEPTSPTAAKHMRSKNGSPGEVFVMREIRQASEAAGTTPAKMAGTTPAKMLEDV